MTDWLRSFPYLAHVHFVHISPIFASPEGEGFRPSPMVTLNPGKTIPRLQERRLRMNGLWIFEPSPGV